jgi:hypothetical protein
MLIFFDHRGDERFYLRFLGPSNRVLALLEFRSARWGRETEWAGFR